MAQKTTERTNFGKIKEVIAPPNLIEIQLDSYREFLQAEVAPSKRRNLGLQAVFTEVFPIESYDGKTVLDFHSYEIQEPKVDWLEIDDPSVAQAEWVEPSHDLIVVGLKPGRALLLLGADGKVAAWRIRVGTKPVVDEKAYAAAQKACPTFAATPTESVKTRTR